MPALENHVHEKFCQSYFTSIGKKGHAAKVWGELIGNKSKNVTQSVCRLLKRPEIKARISELQATVCKGIIKKEIRKREHRLDRYQDLFERMQQVVDERATDLSDVPGGKSGLLVRDYKGKNADVPVYKVDAPAFQVELNLLKQAAIEMGEFVEKREGEGSAVPQNITIEVEFVKSTHSEDIVDITPQLKRIEG